KEALEGIAADEKPKPLPISQMQNPHRGAKQILFGGLEKLVARVCFENIDESLVRVAAWSQLGPRDDIRRLAPKQWYVARIRAVGRRCEQAEKAVLADDLTAGVEALDRYVIEIAGPVDCRA